MVSARAPARIGSFARSVSLESALNTDAVITQGQRTDFASHCYLRICDLVDARQLIISALLVIICDLCALALGHHPIRPRSPDTDIAQDGNDQSEVDPSDDRLDAAPVQRSTGSS